MSKGLGTILCKVKQWWCNPGRWALVFICVAVAGLLVGMVLINQTVRRIAVERVTEIAERAASIAEMAEDRANLQSQIDFLESKMPTKEGPDFPLRER